MGQTHQMIVFSQGGNIFKVMNAEISVRAYRRTFRKPLRTAHGEWKTREGFVVRLEANGSVAFGEVAPIPDFGTETVARAANFLKQWLEDSIIMPSGLPCCYFALSSAMQQLRNPPGPLRRDYAVAGLLPAGPAALASAQEKIAAGYTCLKWKIGVHSMAAEQEVLTDLLRQLPEQVELRLDANAGLDRKRTENWLTMLSDHREHVAYLEQALPPGEEAAMADLARDWGIPIALDESLNMPGRERWLIPGAWEGPLVIKPLLMGNLSLLGEQLKPLAGQLVFSSVFETGIGLAQALRLADLLPESKHAIGFDTVAAFDDALAGRMSAAVISADSRAQMDMETIWNQLSPLI